MNTLVPLLVCLIVIGSMNALVNIGKFKAPAMVRGVRLSMRRAIMRTARMTLVTQLYTPPQVNALRRFTAPSMLLRSASNSIDSDVSASKPVQHLRKDYKPSLFIIPTVDMDFKV